MVSRYCFVSFDKRGFLGLIRYSRTPRTRVDSGLTNEPANRTAAPGLRVLGAIPDTLPGENALPLARAARYVSEFVARDLDATRRMSPHGRGGGQRSAPAPAPAAAGPPDRRPSRSQTSERARYGGPT